jgi:hypothetical protein
VGLLVDFALPNFALQTDRLTATAELEQWAALRKLALTLTLSQEDEKWP